MCGPSSAEKSLQASSASFANLLQNNYGTLFSGQLGVLNAIKNALSPILSAGPNQRGFSAAETSARQTQAINAAGGANRVAQQAARTYGAGQGGGGTSGLTSGVQKQIQAGIATQAAGQEAAQLNQITNEDFATGRENYWRANAGMEQLGNEFNPNATANAAIGENSASFGQANQINQQNNQLAETVAGGLTSLAGVGLKFASGAVDGGGFSGGLKALGGSNG